MLRIYKYVSTGDGHGRVREAVRGLRLHRGYIDGWRDGWMDGQIDR